MVRWKASDTLQKTFRFDYCKYVHYACWFVFEFLKHFVHHTQYISDVLAPANSRM